MQIVVFKIGGSLLDLPGLGEKVLALIAQRPEAVPLLVVGGGPVADVVRRWDTVHQLGEERAHWLAVRSLATNEALLYSLIPDCESVTTREETISAAGSGKIPLLETAVFMASDAQRADRLPACWDVTSDSIAAQVVIHFEAAELVLIKSTDLAPRIVLGEAVRARLVDPYLPKLTPHVPMLSWVNLREETTQLPDIPADDPKSREIMTWLLYGRLALDNHPIAGSTAIG